MLCYDVLSLLTKRPESHFVLSGLAAKAVRYLARSGLAERPPTAGALTMDMVGICSANVGEMLVRYARCLGEIVLRASLGGGR